MPRPATVTPAERAESNRRRQAAYQDRVRAELAYTRSLLADLIGAVSDAAEAGRSAKLTNHLPEGAEGAAELIRRLSAVKLIAARRDSR